MTSIFETERLLVRHFEQSDLDDFAALCADPVALRYVGDGVTVSRERVAEWIDICQQKYQKRGFGTSAVIEKASGQFVGCCGVFQAPESDFDEILYLFTRSTWGKGYATETAQAMIAYVFANFPVDRIYATIRPQNKASINVAIKLGMFLEKEDTNPDDPTLFYVIERAQWEAARRAPR